MSEREIEDLVSYLSVNPDAGDEMVGTGGCRKLRVAGRGKGKSGGYRTVTFFSGNSMPVFLITVFSRSEKIHLDGCGMQGVEGHHEEERQRVVSGQGAQFRCQEERPVWLPGRREGFDEMSKKAFDKIAAGLNEALAVARGTAKPSKLHVPSEIDVLAIR